ncbi:Asp/Glu racemase [Burkholderia sp. WAC0059]|uniref:maleate cis-trans isomerase family protein n=1 Tax=Burkholderia sp. WAC0059 TaxID=2066022 RepID=UPI000C7EC17E|nr:aspartate/glutamate racemase family protein [Burkholderia sp. WAC0059]PLZ00128.1 Asp/Glu racemase [Burkholderia sp. WAC0059]
MNTVALPDNYVRLDFTLDEGVARRAAIGLVVLATDHTIEHEWRKMLTLDGVAFFESRLLNSADITPETLMEMEGRIADAVALLRPGERIDVVAFGCTSASMVIGEERVFERIREVRPQSRCTTPITAARVGLQKLGTTRIGLLTPYVRPINEAMAAYLGERGIDVTAMGSFEHGNDNEVARIDDASLRRAILAVGARDDVDAVFVSCTSLRVAEALAGIEAELGKPVTSSNHAMAWHALRLGGVDDALPQWGRLFTV